MSSPSDSTAANPNLVANYSIDWLNKPCWLAPPRMQPWSNHNLLCLVASSKYPYKVFSRLHQSWCKSGYLFATYSPLRPLFCAKVPPKTPTFPAFFPHFWHCFPTNYSVNMTPCRLRPAEHNPKAQASSPGRFLSARPRCPAKHFIRFPCGQGSVKAGPAGLVFQSRSSVPFSHPLSIPSSVR